MTVRELSDLLFYAMEDTGCDNAEVVVDDNSESPQISIKQVSGIGADGKFYLMSYEIDNGGLK